MDFFFGLWGILIGTLCRGGGGGGGGGSPAHSSLLLVKVFSGLWGNSGPYEVGGGVFPCVPLLTGLGIKLCMRTGSE